TEADLIGGDFYDVFAVAPHPGAVVIGDALGKGPEAAALTGLARHTIRAASLSLPSPAELLAVLNKAILKNAEDRYATATVVRLGRAWAERGRAGRPHRDHGDESGRRLRRSRGAGCAAAQAEGFLKIRVGTPPAPQWRRYGRESPERRALAVPHVCRAYLCARIERAL